MDHDTTEKFRDRRLALLLRTFFNPWREIFLPVSFQNSKGNEKKS